MGYGTGAIMAVPAHDERDFAFATRFGLPIIEVIAPPSGAQGTLGEAYTGDGVMVNSGRVRRPGRPGSGLRRHRRPAGRARRGAPQGQLQAARLADQPPALLGRADPDRLLRRSAASCRCRSTSCPCCCPSSKTTSPRTTAARRWPATRTSCTPPARTAAARRAARPTPWTPSSARRGITSATPRRTTTTAPFDRDDGRATGCRSTCTSAAPSTPSCTCSTRASSARCCRTPATSSFGEPYATLRNQGMIQAEDGQKMSKSKGNVVTPDSVVETLRRRRACASTSCSSRPSSSRSPGTIAACRAACRFLRRFWGFALGVPSSRRRATRAAGARRRCGDGGRGRRRGADAGGAGRADAGAAHALHKTMRKVTGDIETFRFNTAVPP